jgi:hypothetical protein
VPPVDDLYENVIERLADVPLRIVTLEPREIAEVAEVIPCARGLDVLVLHLLARQRLDAIKRLENGARVPASAADVVNHSTAGIAINGLDCPRHIETMDVVANLLALVSEDPINVTVKIRLDQIRQKAVQLDAGVVRAREASTAKAGCAHAKVPTVFLGHHVGGDFAGSEDLPLLSRQRNRIKATVS